MLLFRNVGKEDGEAARRHRDSSSLISIRLCLSVCLCLLAFFLFSISGNNFNMDGISYIYNNKILHSFCVCVCLLE